MSEQVAERPRGRQAFVFPDAVTIAEGKMEIPPAEPSEIYHVGTRRGSPLQNATIGGISFPEYSGGTLTNDPKRQGARVRLTPSRVKAIQKNIGTRVVRWAGEGKERRGTVLSTLSDGFVPVAGDEPLAKYLYCVRVPAEQAEREAQDPPSMLAGS